MLSQITYVPQYSKHHLRKTLQRDRSYTSPGLQTMDEKQPSLCPLGLPQNRRYPQVTQTPSAPFNVQMLSDVWKRQMDRSSNYPQNEFS